MLGMGVMGELLLFLSCLKNITLIRYTPVNPILIAILLLDLIPNINVMPMTKRRR